MKEYTFRVYIAYFNGNTQEVYIKQHAYNQNDAQDQGLMRLFYEDYSGKSSRMKNAKSVEIINIK